MLFSKEALAEQICIEVIILNFRKYKNPTFYFPEETEVYSGHGKPTQIGFEKITILFLKT
jgi:hypothetical protein